MTEPFISRGFVGKRRQAPGRRPHPARPAPVRGFPRAISAGPTPKVRLDAWTFTIEGLVRPTVRWTWDEFHCSSRTRHCPRYPLRDQVGTTRYTLERRQPRHTSGQADSTAGRSSSPPTRMAATRPTCRSKRRSMGGPLWPSFWRSAAGTGARRPGAAGGARALLLEERQVGARAAADGKGQVGLLGVAGYNNHGDPWKEERYS